MRLLEFFSGTKSAGDIAEQLCYEGVSLDLKNADISTDLVTWDYATHEPENFDVIWASSPCTEDNRTKPIGVWNMSSANETVTISLEISEYLDPASNGACKKTFFMYDLPFNDIDGCKYGMPDLKKKRRWNTYVMCFTGNRDMYATMIGET